MKIDLDISFDKSYEFIEEVKYISIYLTCERNKENEIFKEYNLSNFSNEHNYRLVYSFDMIANFDYKKRIYVFKMFDMIIGWPDNKVELLLTSRDKIDGLRLVSNVLILFEPEINISDSFLDYYDYLKTHFFKGKEQWKL